jgi:hypothetical protein
LGGNIDMKKRIMIVVFPSALIVALVAGLIWSQFSNQLPAAAQDVLDSYLESLPGEVALTNISYARDRELFTAEITQPVLHAPVEEYRPSPILYDGDIIRVTEQDDQFPLPAQELWCVTIVPQNKTAEYYFLARHDNLYGETWVLYKSPNSIQDTKKVGCVSLLPIN